MGNYKTEVNNKAIDKLNKLVEVMPKYCQYYFHAKNLSLAPRTRLGYAEDIMLFLQYVKSLHVELNDVEIADIQVSYLNNIHPTDIDSFMSYLEYYEHNGEYHSNNTQGKKRKLAAIRELYKYLCKIELSSSNPALLVDTPKETIKKQVRALDIDEKIGLINEISSEKNLSNKALEMKRLLEGRDRAIVLLFLGTGIRVSELVGLNMDDIDYKHQFFSVPAKGGKYTQHFFNDEILVQLLTYVEDVRPTLNPADDEKALFISRRGTRISVRAVEVLVKKYSTRCLGDAKAISPHKLRSTYGTDLLSATGDIALVSENLGHADISTTKRYYMGQDIERLRKNKEFKIFREEPYE